MVGSSDDPVAPRGRTSHAYRLCPKQGLRGVERHRANRTVGIGPNNQPRIDHVTETRRFDVRDCNADGTTISPPNVPWRMEITVSPTFVPKEVDPRRARAAGWAP